MMVDKRKMMRRKVQAKKIKTASSGLDLANWEKVKIKGSVISEDGTPLEGLIGLEVLKTYDPSLVETAKSGRNREEEHEDQKKEVKKRKQTTLKSKNIQEDIEDGDYIQRKRVKSKKEEAVLKRLAKRKERREKRKETRKQINGTKAPRRPPAHKENTDKKSNDEEEEEEYEVNRFKFVRPPPLSDEETDGNPEEYKEEVPTQVETPAGTPSAISTDDLVGWNGLGVPQVILRALADKGFKTPTEIQTLTLPAAILGKKDILGAAETGSGKTLAFGIPLLAGIMELKHKKTPTGIRKPIKKTKEEQNEKGKPSHHVAHEDSDTDDSDSKEKNKGGPLYAVVLTPTRELAVQVKNHLVDAAKYTDIKVAAVFGGLSVAKQERILSKCPEIVVATPGRFWELYQQDNPHLSKIDDISFLVIDETDRMVEKGHFEELRSILGVLNRDEVKKQSRQNFVFSATLTLVHDLPEHMQRRNLGKRSKFVKQTPAMKIQSLIEEIGISQPKIVDITRSQQTAQNLTECRLICPIDHKDYYLYYFVQRHPGRTIVFCNSIDCVKRLATIFGLLECNPLPLHANMIQKQRLKNLERFRDNPCGLLIATDVAARGLDIPQVEHVIHYQVPRTSENYVHRSGRTARANRNGITVIFMEPGEVKNYVKLYRTLKRTEDLPLFPVSERYLAAVKERVNLAREVDKQELKLRRTQTELGWMKKHAEEMEMIIDGFNDEDDSDEDEDPFVIERKRNRVQLENARASLKSLLAKEIFPRGFSFKYPTSSGQLQMPGMAVKNSMDDTEDNSA